MDKEGGVDRVTGEARGVGKKVGSGGRSRQGK